VKSPNYDVALWYYGNNNYYNAVHFTGLASKDGDTRAEVKDLMNKAAKALFDTATNMSTVDAENAYQLLVKTQGVPTDIKTAAEAKLTAPVVKSPNYDVALWYYGNNNYYNAVHFTGLASKDGDTRPEVQTLMNNAAQALFDAAATMSSAEAQNAYQLLVDTVGVSADLKTKAQAKLSN
ncbi:hypothetical protein, partial [Neobacillus citreus]